MAENEVMLKVKRIYDPPEKADGFRILVDRLWPRGMSKQRAHLDLWMKEIAPSDQLRKWFSHDPKRRAGFMARYREELRDKKELMRQINELEQEHRTLTLLYASRDEQHNQAVALREILEGSHSS
jgi:uncharacterized protein YeaO (DUF488 family)